MAKGKNGDATVTVCHSRTKNLAEITRSADIIIAAIGKPEFLKGDRQSLGMGEAGCYFRKGFADEVTFESQRN